MLVKTFGSAVHGIDAQTITIEVNVSGKTSGYFIVGLPDNAVKESYNRVETAIINSGFEPVRKNILVNMAPADIRKEGSAYDLPIAIATLACGEQVMLEPLTQFIIM